jgi:hypothetical protein
MFDYVIGRTLDIKGKTNYHIDPLNWDEAEQDQQRRLKGYSYCKSRHRFSNFKNGPLKRIQQK